MLNAVKRRYLLILIALTVYLLTSTVALGDEFQKFHLTILHTNDFHGADFSALAREATLIKQIRSDVPHVLYLDAGDTFARGPYHRKFFGALEFAVLNAVDCDALTLGNNEFKATDSLESSRNYLAARIAQANFPIMCANVKSEKDGAFLPKVQPYVIKTVGEMKIGIIGVTTDRIASYPQLEGYSVEDPIQTVQNLFPKVIAECDGVLALTHIGFVVDCRLADRVPKLWAIIGGDSHTALETPYYDKNIPVVQAGDNGRYLGRLDLFFDKQDGRWIITQFKGGLIPITKDIPEDPEIKTLIQSFMVKADDKAA